MVGPRTPQCNCKCAPPVSFDWGRPYRIVGPQTPNYEYAAWTTVWDVPAAPNYPAQYGIDKADLDPDTGPWKMKPLRYEIGKYPTWPIYTETTGSWQRNIAMSATSPPLDGHLDSTTVASVEIPLSIFRDPAKANSAGQQGWWNATEIFRNGVSVGVFSAGDVPFNTRYEGVIRGAYPPQLYTLSAPLTVVESDVWAWDVYVTLQNAGTQNPLNPAPSFFAADGSGIVHNLYPKFRSTTTLFGTTSADTKKFVFGSNGPGGITELTMVTQSGWTRTDLGNTSIRMVNTAGTYTIEFHWGREIPYVLITDAALTGNPSSYTSMRYVPADSLDYVSHYVTASIDETYGKWSPAGSTVFSNKRRGRSGILPPWWYTITGDSLDPGFPSSITVAPI